MVVVVVKAIDVSDEGDDSLTLRPQCCGDDEKGCARYGLGGEGRGLRKRRKEKEKERKG